MSKDSSDKKSKKENFLTREEILSYEEPAKTVQLPSGRKARIKYISIGMILDVMEVDQKYEPDQMALKVTENAVRFMLRKNDQKELKQFSESDRHFLVELASEQWGCNEEYRNLSATESIYERFYKAVREKEQKLLDQITKSLEPLTKNITSQFATSFKWLDLYQSNLTKITIPRKLTERNFKFASDLAKSISYPVLDQFTSIGDLASTMTRIVEELYKPHQLLISNSLLETTQNTFDSFNELIQNFVSFETFAQLPEVIRYYPSLEIHNTSLVIEHMLEDDYEDAAEEILIPDEENLLAWLDGIDPALGRMLQGAKQTIFSDNSDKFRHFASSHRELEMHLLHIFAPDEDIKNWTDNPDHFHQNRPKRKTRLQYIARNIEDSKFVEFYIKDGLNQMDLLNADEHRKHHGYSIEMLTLLHKRFLAWLSFLREIVKNNDPI